MLLVASLAAAVLIALLAMFHGKVMIVDGLLTSVGSTPFDARSFPLDDEAKLNLHDPAFARRMTEAFVADLREPATAWLAPLL